MNRLPTIICIAYLLISNVSAQIPTNFNFLNHSFIVFEDKHVTEVQLLDDELIAIHNQGLDLVKYEYDLKNEWHFPSSEYKFIYVSDSTYHYLSWVHAYGDIVDNTLITTSFEGEQRMSHTYDNLNYYDALGFDITHDTTGGWWCVGGFGTELLHLKNGEVIDTVNINLIRPKIYTSCKGDIYLIKFGEVYYFDGQDLQYITELPSFSQAYQYDGFNYLLHSDQLYKYDCDMRTKLHEWTLPISVGSFNQIDIGSDDYIHIEDINIESYKIFTIDSLSQITSEYLGAVQDDERINGIKVTSDSTHLIFGEHEFELSNQTFYRCINTKHQSDYPTVDLQISDFDLEYYDAGIEYDFFTGDSVSIQRSKTELTINNLGSDSIYILNIFSNYYRVFFDYMPEDYIRAGIDSLLLPFESRKADGFYLEATTLQELQNLRVELTGANYKFLENGSQVLFPNLLLSGIESAEFEPFDIYPNPAVDYIEVSLSQDDQVSIFSADGRLCSPNSAFSTIGKIDVSDLIAGMYFVVLQNKDKPSRIGKFIKL